jgi:putative membrane protein
MLTRFEKIALIAAYFAVALLLGIHPVDRADWALENSVPFLEGLAVVLYFRVRGVELSRLAYGLIFIHLVVQMIGGHYTYEREPLFSWLRDTLHWQRNHYDRLAHFALGFCLYVPIREICLRRTPLRSSRAWSAFFTLMTITAAAGLWEVWEWLVAAYAHPDLGAAYLGLQGDPWDSQKDIIMAPIGALAALVCVTRRHDALLEGIQRTEPAQ